MITRPGLDTRFRFWMGQRLPKDAIPWAREQMDSPLWALRMVVIQSAVVCLPMTISAAALLGYGRGRPSSLILVCIPAIAVLGTAVRLLVNFDREKARHWSMINGNRRAGFGELPSAQFLIGLAVSTVVLGIVLYLTVVR